MNILWERILDPGVLALSIPVLAVLLWGLTSVIRALRGDPEDFEEWKKELDELRARVDELERASKSPQQQP